MKKYFLMSVLWLIGIMGTLSMWAVNAQEINKDIVLEATATASGQTLKINKYFSNAYTVDRWDGTTWNLTVATKHTYSAASGYTIILSLSWSERWRFQWVTPSESRPLVPKVGTTMTWVKIVSMPSLADGFWASATAPGNYFFEKFNEDWALIELPDNSFDTSNITTVGNDFFESFNENWQLTSLPTGSFDTSNITTAGNDFFYQFNRDWQLTSLPDNSFDISNITMVGELFFFAFNLDWKLTSLPTGSFDTSNITTAGRTFFQWFNHGWQLTSLPEGSFRLSMWLTTVGDNFFFGFNAGWWAITSLPEWSFKTENITTVGSDFFSYLTENDN